MEKGDVTYEEDILRNPYSLKNWIYYLEFKSEARPEVRNLIYERATRILPRSYKLWVLYLQERMKAIRPLCVVDVAYEKVNNCFERCLVHMHKMPVLWKMYLTFLLKQKHLITRTRQTFDRALKALPVTQHLRWVWPLYITFVQECGVPETAMRVYRRYLRVSPEDTENFIKFLKKSGRLDHAAKKLAEVVNDEFFVSQHGKSKHDMWTELLTLLTKNPAEVKSLNVDAIIRGGIRRFTHEVGRLWCALGDYYIRLGHFEKARDVYEEGINTVATVRDFSLIFDAYSQFEESMLAAKMEATATEAGVDDEEDEEDVDIDLRIMRVERLLERRPLLLSSVLLRQNPHNCNEWMKRVKLFTDPGKIIMTFTDAVTTIDPQRATGSPHGLWTQFAKFYEKHGDLANARVIFDKATHVNYRNVDALATVWCEYAEMELRHNKPRKALEVMKRSTSVPRTQVKQWKKGGTAHLTSQERLYKSTKIWSFYADLEENLGTVEGTKAVYEKMVELKVSTPQTILNYAQFMEDNKYFEDSYRVYEKGIALFKYPHVGPIWLTYLQKFTSRYLGNKLERARDLFEQSVDDVPAKQSQKLFLLYAKYEEQYGLTRRAMDVYSRACDAAAVTDKREMFRIYIARCAEFFGHTKTREIYEKAIAELPDDDLKELVLQYALMEKALGEIDRSRAIFVYGSQFNDPRADVDYWKQWHEFEFAHGNEDTFREMLRVRRSVRAQFSQLNLMTVNIKKKPAASKEPPKKPGLVANQGKRPRDGDQEEKTPPATSSDLAAAAAKGQANPEEISLDMSDSEDEEDGDGGGGGGGIVKAGVPDAVFGGIKDLAEKQMGAKDRFKKAGKA